MKLPSTAHTSRPWRIHGIVPDFRLEDVWALPTPGGPDDLAWLVAQFAEERGGKSGISSPLYRILFAIRWKLGALLGWDEPGDGVGAGGGWTRCGAGCPPTSPRGCAGPTRRAPPSPPCT